MSLEFAQKVAREIRESGVFAHCTVMVCGSGNDCSVKVRDGEELIAKYDREPKAE